MAVFQPNPVPDLELKMNRFRGLNVSVDKTQIQPNESPHMLNMMLDGEGAITQRTGFTKAYPTSLGAGRINAMYDYRKADGTLLRLVHHATTLYVWDGDPETMPITLFSSMANAPSRSFVMNNLLYIMDGVRYLQFDGVSIIPVVPYIPVVSINSAPNGTGRVANEQFNLLTARFENWFTGDGASTAYQLSLTTLGSLTVTASTNFGQTYNLVEGVDLTVNRTTGVVTFNVAPPTTADANNVRIRASAPDNTNYNKIYQSQGLQLFGGANDSRVWVWNGHTLYRSGPYQPTYFPENGFQQIGTESEPIMGMCLQYDTAIISTTYSKWLMSVNDADLLNILYPVRPLNSAVGCQARNSIQLVNNNVVALTDTGVWSLMSSNVRDERNVSHQSRRVDPMLLRETDFANAISVDFDNKYFITFPSTGRTYIWDYTQPQQDPTQLGEWYFWDNIKASCYYWLEDELFFGSSVNGMVYKFARPEEVESYNDDGVAIHAIWDSALFDFDASQNYKTVKNLYFELKPYNRMSCDVYYFSEENIPQLLGTTTQTLFSYGDFSYADFSYLISTNPQVGVYKVKAKKVTHFQIRFENNKIDERFGLLSVVLRYVMKRYVK